MKFKLYLSIAVLSVFFVLSVGRSQPNAEPEDAAQTVTVTSYGPVSVKNGVQERADLHSVSINSAQKSVELACDVFYNDIPRDTFYIKFANDIVVTAYSVDADGSETKLGHFACKAHKFQSRFKFTIPKEYQNVRNLKLHIMATPFGGSFAD